MVVVLVQNQESEKQWWSRMYVCEEVTLVVGCHARPFYGSAGALDRSADQEGGCLASSAAGSVGTSYPRDAVGK